MRAMFSDPDRPPESHQFDSFVLASMFDMPQEMLERQKEKAIKQAIRLLISNGLIKASDISAIFPFCVEFV
ncbi:hypothetical protein [Sporomusa acidovorans]|uniref:hypothetical protein n=1 Tax=Sporomusa acidovorans TaxID=112900 RepID=UPI000B851354|nr:hypothetical protein [Sporomusa acidovorans]